MNKARINTLAFLIETGAIRDKKDKPVACVMDMWNHPIHPVLARTRPVFYPDWRGGFKGSVDDWAKITPKRMARTLRRLAKTGVVDWS